MQADDRADHQQTRGKVISPHPRQVIGDKIGQVERRQKQTKPMIVEMKPEFKKSPEFACFPVEGLDTIGEQKYLMIDSRRRTARRRTVEGVRTASENAGPRHHDQVPDRTVGAGSLDDPGVNFDNKNNNAENSRRYPITIRAL
jgi:hypothetical protein